MELTKNQTPNSRLLFKESLEIAGDWYLIADELGQFIENQRQFQLANGELIIYFFAPSQSASFADENIWVGKEVIGPSEIDDEEFDLYDLEAGFCYSHKVDLTHNLPLQEIYRLESEIRQNSSLNFAASWRIRLSYPSDLFSAKIELYEAGQAEIEN